MINMEILIDLMEKEDIDEIMRIEKDVFNDPWSKNAFISELEKNPHAIYFTARSGREILGYIGFWILKDYIHITNLAVAKKYQKKGIASLLLENVENTAGMSRKYNLYLEVRESNTKAIDFYKKRNFEIVDSKKNYYENNNEDALIMWKVINNG